MMLSEIENCANFDRVDVEGLVVKIHSPFTVRTGKRKQDVVIDDRSGTVKQTLWEEMIGTLKENHSYQFSKMLVRGYGGVKSLSFPREGGRRKKCQVWKVLSKTMMES